LGLRKLPLLYPIGAASGSALAVIKVAAPPLRREYNGKCHSERAFNVPFSEFIHHAVMNRSQQPKVNTLHRSSRPPVLTPIDNLIDHNQGSSVALEATRARMEPSKHTTPTPFQRVEQLTRENAALREEMARFHRLQSANAYFIKETKDALDLLQQAVFEWRKAQKDIDNDFKKEDSDYGVETGSIKVAMNGAQ
jgi:hypothetical protein